MIAYAFGIAQDRLTLLDDFPAPFLRNAETFLNRVGQAAPWRDTRPPAVIYGNDSANRAGITLFALSRPHHVGHKHAEAPEQQDSACPE
jgi:hypothetical protein